MVEIKSIADPVLYALETILKSSKTPLLEPDRQVKSVQIFAQFRKKYAWLTEEYFEDVEPRKIDRFWTESLFHNSPLVL